MKADPRGVLTGTHFIDGDHACCEGALAAGARFAAGYPITPSTELVERSYGWWQLYTDGRRTGGIHHPAGRCLGRG